MPEDSKALEQLFKQAALELGLSDEDAAALTFHMTDWLGELEAFNRLVSEPASHSSKQAGEALMAFLLHAPAHIAAAAKLATGLPVGDVFGVGAVGE